MNICSVQHGNDRAGNRTHRENTLAGTMLSELYQYDLLHRLVAITRGELNGSKDDIVAQQWGLDGVGNWPTFREDSDGNETWDIDQTRTHTDANEIETISGGGAADWPHPDHDAAGNMTVMPKPLELAESFTAAWDAWDRLIKLTDDADNDATVAEYRWDGEGRRIVAAVYDDGQLDHTRHFYYHSHSIIEERVDGTADIDMDIQYVWGLQYVDELIARHDGTAWLFALQDANYRVTAIVNASGTVVERYSYTAYGQRTVLNPNWSEHAQPHEGSFNFRIGHQGLRHDESGLVYNRARMLHVTLGRFTARDPAGYVDGMQLYANYGALLRRLDPSGRQIIVDPEDPVNMPWYEGPLEGAHGAVFVCFRFRCDCREGDGYWELVDGSLEIKVIVQLDTESIANADNPDVAIPGVYGHEQRHVASLQWWLQHHEGVDEMRDELGRNRRFRSQRACENHGFPDVPQKLNEIVRCALAHHNDDGCSSEHLPEGTVPPPMPEHEEPYDPMDGRIPATSGPRPQDALEGDGWRCFDTLDQFRNVPPQRIWGR